VRHACSVIRARQYRESSCAGAPLAREPENIEAAGKAKGVASDPFAAPEATKGRETNAPCPRETTKSTGAWKTNMPDKETAAVRRDGESLTSMAQKRRQREAAGERHQAIAGEKPPPSVREETRFLPPSATDPKSKLRDTAGTD
jgi:hypothetical protein